MKVVIAIDSFKDSMTSLEAGNAAKDGVLRVFPRSEVKVFQVADGGEGTVQALCGSGNLNSSCCETRVIMITGPLGNRIEASYNVILDFETGNKTAIIELAQAAGLMLVPKNLRNPLNATTYGLGEMIRDAVLYGCRSFIIGIGGSATNDGGIGMLQALGYSFRDSNGREVRFGAKGLMDICDIGFENVMYELNECTFRIACDVANPLVGENGASLVFSPQKGADVKLAQDMDRAMNRYADLAEHIAVCDESEIHTAWKRKCDIHNVVVDRFYPGVGAAGGLGYAFMMFLNASLEPGVDIVLDEIKLENDIKSADYVITGEGKLDSQTIMGKTPFGVAKMAKKYGKRVIAFAGEVDDGVKDCFNAGFFDACFSILRGVTTLELALDKNNARDNLSNAVEQVFRVIALNNN